MNIVLLQGRLSLQEINLLLKEFPQYLFLSLGESAYKNMISEHWEHLEIIYGSKLTKEELLLAPQLRWVHSPIPHLNRLCMHDIEKRGNILVTNTTEENIPQIGEYVMAGILAFAKNLFAWREASHSPVMLWDSKWRDNMWSLKNKVLLQIGLGRIGTEIARRARQMDLHVWGMKEHASFHPYCHKTFEIKNMHAYLPQADVVSISLARGKEYHNWFQQEELELMKQDSILVVIGSSTLVNEEALAQTAKSGKFRGILFDAYHQTPIPAQSLLWTIPNLLITPEVSPRPKSTENHAFRTFLYNLRQYIHGNYRDFRNMIRFLGS